MAATSVSQDTELGAQQHAPRGHAGHAAPLALITVARRWAQTLELIPMRVIKAILAVLIVGLMFLGLVYNLILPSTPPWFDLIAWVAIGTAFLIAYAISRKRSGPHAESGVETKRQ